MVRSVLLVSLLGGAVVGSAGPAAAQPAGSYQRSCEDVRYEAGRLTATCGGVGGGARTTTIDASRCRGDIGNNNGVLSCAGATADNVRLEPGRAVAPSRGGPSGFGGSYQRSCRNVSTSGSRLTATCATGRGESRTSTLDTSRCRGEIGNDAGLLVCDGAVASEGRGGRSGYGDRRGGYDPRDSDGRGSDGDRRGRYDPRYDDRSRGDDDRRRYDDPR